MYNRRYDKIFIMLRQETAGYGMGQRTPWGSCIMEMKNGTGRLTISIDGLRPLHYGEYRVYAMAGEGEEQISLDCGSITPDIRGRCSMKWEFSPDNIENKGVTAEEMHTVAVLAERDNSFTAPLTAYFSDKKPWQKFHRSYVEREQKEKEFDNKFDMENDLSAAEAAAMHRTAETGNISKEKKADGEKNTEKFAGKPIEKPTEKKPYGESYHGSFRGLLEKFRQELSELEETGVFGKEDMERIKKAGSGAEKITEEAVKTPEAEPKPTHEPMHRDIQTEAQNKTTAKNEIIKKHEKPIHYLLKNAQVMYPFGQEGGMWRCIAPDELILLDNAPLSWQRDLFFWTAYMKYQHFIFNESNGEISLGVPGRNEAAEERRARARGFREIKAMAEDDKLGYWLIKMK